jgi:hypothetical protein
MGKPLIIGLLVVIALFPAYCLAGSPEVSDSSYWSALIHEENSLLASVLYIPYIAFQIPVRIVDGIINPKPASQAVVPPPAHRPH